MDLRVKWGEADTEFKLLMCVGLATFLPVAISSPVVAFQQSLGAWQELIHASSMVEGCKLLVVWAIYTTAASLYPFGIGTGCWKFFCSKKAAKTVMPQFQQTGSPAVVTPIYVNIY